MTKRILFVDDEPMVLSGLERSLYSMRAEWEMVYVTGGREALQSMAEKPFDVIVTDVRMPEMGGAQLLEEVKQRFPGCLRFVLSGQADKETILKTVNPAHQFLSKPCKPEELKLRLARAFAVRGLLQNDELRELVSKLDSLPSLPTLYVELTNEINQKEPSVGRIGRLVSMDMAMTAKILQLVNSSFFGLRTQVSNPSSAVELLGMDIIRALVLSAHVFSKFRTDLLSEEDMQYFWQHSLAVGGYSKRIAVMENSARRVVEDCFTAGLLHDVGKLILASVLSVKYKEVLSLVMESGANLVVAESQVLGCSHAEVGAYLLGLWGLPDSVIEGVACHHNPAESFQTGFSTVLATHIASIYHEQQNPFWLQDNTKMDVEYLRSTACLEREKEWRAILQEAPSEVGQEQ